MATSRLDGRKLLQYHALTDVRPAYALSESEQALSEFGLYLKDDARERLRDLERVKLDEWKRNRACGNGNSGNGGYRGRKKRIDNG